MMKAGPPRRSGAAWGTFREGALGVSSLIATPLLLFISSSTRLYLNNQALFQHQVAVLLPFVKLFFISFVVGLALLSLARHRLFRCALWAYYLAGPAFLVFSVFCSGVNGWPLLSALYETAFGLALWPAALLLISIGLGFRLSPRSLLQPFAAFSLVLMVLELWSFYSRTNALGQDRAHRQLPPAASNASAGLPNIYHVVLDEFQTDFFELALTPQTKRALGGFTYFPENRSKYAYTPLSMASVYKGKAYAYDRTRAQFIAEAYNSRGSLLYWLKDRGYTTVAYLHGTVSDIGPSFSAKALRRYSLFDRMISLRDRAPVEFIDIHTDTFLKLWLFANVASPARRWLEHAGWIEGFTAEELKLLRDRRLLTRSDPLTSLLGFRSFVDDEDKLPASGRYTLLHLMLPHSPYELRADCSLPPDGSPTGPIQQSKCALKLMGDLIGRLKRLHRFEESLIIIHGDHGGNFRVKKGRLTADARSRSLRALLLLKPIGATGRETLTVSREPANLLDIAPAIMSRVTAGARGRRTNGVRNGLNPSSAPSIVPFIEGESLWSARRVLTRQGFQIGRIVRAPSQHFAPDAVIAQHPSPYEPVTGPRRIDLLLSGGEARPILSVTLY